MYVGDDMSMLVVMISISMMLFMFMHDDVDGHDDVVDDDHSSCNIYHPSFGSTDARPQQRS